MPSNQWKDRLLKSGVPLEHAAATLVVNRGFSITSDYIFGRVDSGMPRDFSVDVRAVSYLPQNDPGRIDGTLNLLVECKYRTDAHWVFIEDPNLPDMSPFTLGGTLNVIDGFSRFEIPADPIVSFESKFPMCYKAIEIRAEKEVFEAEIRHGINQLRYAGQD